MNFELIDQIPINRAAENLDKKIFCLTFAHIINYCANFNTH